MEFNFGYEDIDNYMYTIFLNRIVEKYESIDDLPLMDKKERIRSELEKILDSRHLSIDQNQIEEDIMKCLYQRSKDIMVLEQKHEPWLEKYRTKILWHHRDAYSFYLLNYKKWKRETYRTINMTTDIILDHIGNPMSDNGFDNRGLVIGEVQSGKTANYIGLINKAIDAGYKLIFILAGQQNDLRSQTQKRIDNDVIGFDTVTHESKGVKFSLQDIEKDTINAITSADSKGDFKKIKGLILTGERPCVAVMKKNTTVLKNMLDHLHDQIVSANTQKIKMPVLIIDDEVDQASVNTSKDSVNNPTKINERIRDIISLCEKVSYVGYTATPFANILIDANIDGGEHGDDLFPKDYIVCLPTSEDYCGVETYFGSKQDPKYDLIRIIQDASDFVDEEVDDEAKIVKFKPHEEIKRLNESLKEAIDDFIVASAVRRSRGTRTHNAMMIHLAAYVDPAKSLKTLVENHIDDLKSSYRYDMNNQVEHYRDVWERRFKEVRLENRKQDAWSDIVCELDAVLELMKVKLLNGSSKDIIDYSDIEESQYIAVGGNKLSRGITIEGLMISYYLRDPRAYDTAMQMGRWFGYKKDYIDLCRIYSIPQTIDSFIEIADATNELKTDIMEMGERKLTPMEFGLKIVSKSSMMPTSASKMRSSTKMKISFGEQRVETTRFDFSKAKENLGLVRNTVEKLQSDVRVKNDSLAEGTPVFRHVSSEVVLDFLKSFHDVDTAHFNLVQTWKQYIEIMVENNELTNWTFVVSSLNEKNNDSIDIAGHKIIKGTRMVIDPNDNFTRVFANPNDFKYALIGDELRKEFKLFPKNNSRLRSIFTKDQALLTVYVNDITYQHDVIRKNIVGIAIWFPYTNNENSKIDYFVNSIYGTPFDKREAEEYDED